MPRRRPLVEGRQPLEQPPPLLGEGVPDAAVLDLSRRSALSLRHRELVVDRTTALCGADYEWGVHVAVFADKVDLTSDQAVSLAHGDASDGCWPDPADQAVLRAVDQLHATNDLSDEAWSELVTATHEDGALEIMLLCAGTTRSLTPSGRSGSRSSLAPRRSPARSIGCRLVHMAQVCPGSPGS